MATYLILNSLFFVTLLVLRPRHQAAQRSWWFMLAILLALTAVFDSFIVGLGIVGYDTHKLLGLFIGRAPVEDFFYPLYAACFIPLIWSKLERYGKD